MSSLAIHIDNLSKSYLIRHDRPKGVYRTLRESLVDATLLPFRRMRGNTNSEYEEFWALNNLYLEIKQGESVGIIGRNGAGKSTLLKILSRITAPTTGRITLRGRVGSLLEVGTGFHPELTGRENIFLNGSILGMSHAEIQNDFDSIVDFSGVEKFLDTPVKRYSSGMYVRLAFGVAAHLKPEILLIDEVLAVGDMEFQQKCLGKMSQIAGEGRTILFVSHNMAAIQNFCKQCIVINAGSIVFNGPMNNGIDFYLKSINCNNSQSIDSRVDRKGAGNVRFTSLEILDMNDNITQTVAMGTAMQIRLKYKCSMQITRPAVGIIFYTNLGQRLFRLHTRDQGVILHNLQTAGTLNCKIPSVPLLPGRYHIKVGISDAMNILQDELDSAMSLEVVAADVFGTGHIPNGQGDTFYVPSTWTLCNDSVEIWQNTGTKCYELSKSS
jgi:lipopolysaccharide transport system ATP-binding protein